MNQPRQCPGCKTWYAPQVEKCECECGAINKNAIDKALQKAKKMNKTRNDKSGSTYTVKPEDIQSYYNC